MANPINVPGFEDGMIYGTGDNSSVGKQLIDFYWQKKALIDLKKEQYFGQLADTTAMPKHFGKAIKRYHIIPLLDDRNINDQGIDATGKNVEDEVTIVITDPAGSARYAVGQGVDAATALVAARAKAVDIFKNIGAFDTDYATTVAALTAAGWYVEEGPAVNNSGNLYGSSKDIGTIVDKLPVISETGGRVNRVGFTRLTIEGTIEEYGWFYEYTRDSVDFDNDPELHQHISRENLKGANEITEALLQIDLLNAANVVFYGGDATSASELTGEVSAPQKSELTYDMLTRLETALNNNRCPKDTTIITGSRMIDTRTIGACRYVYIGPELRQTLLRMKNYHDEPAFIPVQQYGEAGRIATGEIGSIGSFRFIEVPDMFHWEGAGAAVTNNGGYIEGNGKYNVYPLLVVGSGSFTNIGFQSGDGSKKFEIYNIKPGRDAVDRVDPFGKTGLSSIQFWYGSMALRPEWIAVAKVVAKQ